MSCTQCVSKPICSTFDYMNPFSKGFKKAAKNFADLSLSRKILVIFLSVIVGIVTLGLGAIPTFRYKVTSIMDEISSLESTISRLDLPIRRASYASNKSYKYHDVYVDGKWHNGDPRLDKKWEDLIEQRDKALERLAALKK